MHIHVRKEMDPWPAFTHMWKGECTCGSKWQFWFFGATLGYGLEHLRRCNGATNIRRG